MSVELENRVTGKFKDDPERFVIAELDPISNAAAQFPLPPIIVPMPMVNVLKKAGCPGWKRAFIIDKRTGRPVEVEEFRGDKYRCNIREIPDCAQTIDGMHDFVKKCADPNTAEHAEYGPVKYGCTGMPEFSKIRSQRLLGGGTVTVSAAVSNQALLDKIAELEMANQQAELKLAALESRPNRGRKKAGAEEEEIDG